MIPDGEASLPPVIQLKKKVLARFPGKDLMVLLIQTETSLSLSLLFGCNFTTQFGSSQCLIDKDGFRVGPWQICTRPIRCPPRDRSFQDKWRWLAIARGSLARIIRDGFREPSAGGSSFWRIGDWSTSADESGWLG